MLFLKNIGAILRNLEKQLLFNRTSFRGIYNQDLFEKIKNYIGYSFDDVELNYIPSEPKYFDNKLKTLPGLLSLAKAELIIKVHEKHKIFISLFNDLLDYVVEPAKRTPAVVLFPVAKFENKKLSVDLKTIYSTKQNMELLANYVEAGCRRTGREISTWLEFQRFDKPLIFDERKVNLVMELDGDIVVGWDKYLFQKELRELLFFSAPLEELYITDRHIEEIKKQKFYTEYDPGYLLELITAAPLEKGLVEQISISYREKTKENEVLNDARYYYVNPQRQDVLKDIIFHYYQQLIVFQANFEKAILPKFKALQQKVEMLEPLLKRYTEFTTAGLPIPEKILEFSELLSEIGYRYFFNIYESTYEQMVTNLNIREEIYTLPDEKHKQLYLQFKVFAHFHELIKAEIGKITEYRKLVDYKKVKDHILGLNKKLYFVSDYNDPQNQNVKDLGRKKYLFELLLDNSAERANGQENKKDLRRLPAVLEGRKGYYFVPEYYFRTENVYLLINIYGELQMNKDPAYKEMGEHLLREILRSGVALEKLQGIAGERHPLAKKIELILEQKEKERIYAELQKKREADKEKFNTGKGYLFGAVGAVFGYGVAAWLGSPAWLRGFLAALCAGSGYLGGGKLFRKNGLWEEILLLLKKPQTLQPAKNGNGKKTNGGVIAKPAPKPVEVKKPAALAKLAEASNVLANIYTKADLEKKFNKQELEKIMVNKDLQGLKVMGKEYFIPTYLIKTPGFLEKLREKYRETSNNKSAKMGERALAEEFLNQLAKIR